MNQTGARNITISVAKINYPKLDGPPAQDIIGLDRRLKERASTAIMLPNYGSLFFYIFLHRDMNFYHSLNQTFRF
jgi:hypothetical protein